MKKFNVWIPTNPYQSDIPFPDFLSIEVSSDYPEDAINAAKRAVKDPKQLLQLYAEHLSYLAKVAAEQDGQDNVFAGYISTVVEEMTFAFDDISVDEV